MKGWYKVPLRQSYTETIGQWFKQTLWCHMVLRFFRSDVEQAMGITEPGDGLSPPQTAE
jgi:hypothetical protein